MALSFMVLSTNCFGQGSWVSFNNNGVPVGGDHKVYFDSVDPAGPPVVGTNYVAELYYAPGPPDDGSLTPFVPSISQFRQPFTTVPGTWSGKSLTLPIGGFEIPIILNVRVWDSLLAASYEEAAAAGGSKGYFGESGNFSYVWRQFVHTPVDTEVQMVNMPAFALVPEPSTIVVSILGIFGFLFFRWKHPGRETHA